MRKFFSIILLVLAMALTHNDANAALNAKVDATVDSLQRELNATTDSAKRISLLIDLSDIMSLQQGTQYAEELLKIARETKDQNLFLIVLPKLAWWEIWKRNDEKVEDYCNEMRKVLPPDVGRPMALMMEMQQQELSINDCNTDISLATANTDQ